MTTEINDILYGKRGELAQEKHKFLHSSTVERVCMGKINGTAGCGLD